MRGISEERLHQIIDSFLVNDMLFDDLRSLLISECIELNPWLPIDEFLKSPKYGWCWIYLKNNQVHIAYVGYNDFDNYVFYCDDSRDEEYNINDIAAVMHMPEPTHYQELPDDPV